eukprot:342108_1
MEVEKENRKGVKPTVVWAALSASLGGVVFGYDIGGAGGTFTMTSFQEKFGWPTEADNSDAPMWVSNEMGWIMSTFALGAIVGSSWAGTASDWLGRKKAIQLFAFIFTVGALFQLLCNVITYLYIGRILGGIGVGGLSTVSPIYLSEISPAYMRGTFIAFQQLSITFGIFLASSANMGLQYWDNGWRISYAGSGLFAIAVFFLMFFCVESPRWLVKVGNNDGAMVVLKTLHYEEEVVEELQNIVHDEKMSQIAHSTKWKDLFDEKRDMKFRTIVGISEAALGAVVGLCFVNFVSTLFSLRLVEKIGRRNLMIYGAGFMVFFSYCIVLLVSPSIYGDSIGFALIFLFFNALYVAAFEFSWGPIGWIIPSEIFPLELRGKAVSLSTVCNWSCNFLVGRMTPILIRSKVFDINGTYAFFGSCCVALVFFSFLYVPETKGIELEHMDAVFRDFRNNSMAERLRHIELKRSTSSMERPGEQNCVLEPQESLRKETNLISFVCKGQHGNI